MRSISTRLTLFRVALHPSNVVNIRISTITDATTQAKHKRISTITTWKAGQAAAAGRRGGGAAPVFHPFHNLHGHSNILIGLVQLVTRSLQLPPLAIEIAQHCAACVACPV